MKKNQCHVKGLQLRILTWNSNRVSLLIKSRLLLWPVRPKGHRFDSLSGHMPRLQVQSPVRACSRGNQSVFLTSVFLLPFPSLISSISTSSSKDKNNNSNNNKRLLINLDRLSILFLLNDLAPLLLWFCFMWLKINIYFMFLARENKTCYIHMYRNPAMRKLEVDRIAL